MRLLSTKGFSCLKQSYGSIQCCERQARLFFHFSQFYGNIEHLKIGDPVEFEVTYDPSSGKLIASFVSKIAPEVVRSMRQYSSFQISIIDVFVSSSRF
jgi:cold shock CspA family protein